MMKIWKSMFGPDAPISTKTHPCYDQAVADWGKFRATYSGGKPFVQKYLKKFSNREDNVDFNTRRNISYCPAHAKSSVNDIKNAIYQRMIDITRAGGPDNYHRAVAGDLGGVDYNGNTMNGFIGRLLLPELLSMAKVGVFIDKDAIGDIDTINDSRDQRPYMYMYKTEDIRSWTKSKEGVLTALLLRDTNDNQCPTTGLTIGQTTAYRFLRLVKNEAGDLSVHVKFYDKSGKEDIDKRAELDLTRIPFVIFELSQSLLVDVADYQIALLNVESSDINYSLKSNFPFYIEQFNPMLEMVDLREATQEKGQEATTKPGEAVEAETAKPKTQNHGAVHGRKYPKGMDAPAFIHPSPEPLLASMKKGDQLKEDIKKLVNLAVTNVSSASTSGDSKREDAKSLEAGLSYIGLELEYGENLIASIWAEYEGTDNVTKIKYPENYSLKTEEDRMAESEKKRKQLPTIPSITYQRAMAKDIVILDIGHRLQTAELKKIFEEIDKSPVVVTDPDVIEQDHEAGFVGTEMASELRGYPKGQAKIAAQDHADRAARIAVAQSKAVDQARGVNDLGNNPKAGEDEKDKSRNTDQDVVVKDKTRGEA